MWSVLCMCVFTICIDSCAWRIGYKLGNILACKWNILDCRSILGGVLNSQGHYDILFVGVKNLWYCVCMCLVQLLYRGDTWVTYVNKLTSQYIRSLSALAIIEVKVWVCLSQTEQTPPKPMVTTSTALSTSQGIHLLVYRLTHQAPFRSKSGSRSF